MNTYVWQNLKEGYVQGMCDIAAPLLVIMDDEVAAYGCFVELMKRLIPNFPLAGGGMDRNFANMRSLIQVLDPELFSMMKSNGDYTHFYFCYRWFLLDFKRGSSSDLSLIFKYLPIYWYYVVDQLSFCSYRAGLRRRFCRMGVHLGGFEGGQWGLCPFSGISHVGMLSWYHSGQCYGFHWHYQIFQR